MLKEVCKVGFLPAWEEPEDPTVSGSGGRTTPRGRGKLLKEEGVKGTLKFTGFPNGLSALTGAPRSPQAHWAHVQIRRRPCLHRRGCERAPQAGGEDRSPGSLLCADTAPIAKAQGQTHGGWLDPGPHTRYPARRSAIFLRTS